MKQYINLVNHVLNNGVYKPDRTGVGTLSVFGYQTRFDLTDGLPVVTTKYIHLKSVIHEFIWMIVRGDTNTKYLVDNGVSIWNEWADGNGDLGPVYGKQFRSWNGCIDQVQNVIDGIKSNPYSRRHIISLWNVSDLKDMALEPCHAFTQFYVNDGKLSCQLYQRSADVGLGVPFNITFYSIFTHVIAQLTGLQPGEFVHTFGDAHIYVNHIEALKTQTTRKPLELPKLNINQEVDNINDFRYDDFQITGYQYHPAIKLPIAV
jgi:thymidylate synthase